MKHFFLFLLLIFSTILFGQSNEILTNETIIKLHTAGLGAKILISKIETSRCNFDLSTDGLIKLKKSAVSDEVIAAMISKNTNSGSSTLNQTEMQNNPVLSPGIYFCKGSPCDFVELDANIFSQEKTGSGVASMLTYGLAKTKNKTTLSGDKANFQIESNNPHFYFYFSKSSGTNKTNENITIFNYASTPNEFILVKFSSQKNKSREVVTGSYSSSEGLSFGIDDANKIAFKYEKISQGVYKVYFEPNIKAGEYCFMYAGDTGGNSKIIQKVYDFGIK